VEYIFFLLKLIIIVIKKIVKLMGSTRPNSIHVGWIRLGCTFVVGWVGLNFLPHHGGLDRKIPSIRPMHTPIPTTCELGIPSSTTILLENLFLTLPLRSNLSSSKKCHVKHLHQTPSQIPTNTSK